MGATTSTTQGRRAPHRLPANDHLLLCTVLKALPSPPTTTPPKTQTDPIASWLVTSLFPPSAVAIDLGPVTRAVAQALAVIAPSHDNVANLLSDLLASAVLDDVHQQPPLATLLALWLPMYRTCAGIESADPPPPPAPLPFARSVAPPPPISGPVIPPQRLVTFAPTHCAPKHGSPVPPALVTWATENPHALPTLRQVLALYLARPYLLSTGRYSPLPHLLNDRRSGLMMPHVELRGSTGPTLVRPEHMLVLTQAMPTAMRSSWHLAYSSARDGRAWTALHRGLVSTAGSTPASAATVLVVRDTAGAVFGGYVSAAPLPLGPGFVDAGTLLGSRSSRPSDAQTEDPAALVFALSPHLRVYRPTGLNGNLFYCNGGSSTLPNGIGWGGQLDYFGLFLGSDLEHGHSRTGGETSVTFGNECVASAEDWAVDSVEAWVVECGGWERSDVETDALFGRGGAGGKSVLDAFPELVEMLEMNGRKMYSKDVRPESDPAPVDL